MSIVNESKVMPKGWRWVKLDDVCSVISKGTTPTTFGFSYTSSGVPFLRAEDVNGKVVNCSQVTFHISSEADEFLIRSRLLPGDFLVTIAGTLGRVGYLAKDAPQMNCNQAVAFARPINDIVDVEYLVLACQHQDIISPLLDLKAGGALQNLNLQQIRGLKIPLPQLPEQRRIADKLQREMNAVEKASAAAQTRLEAVKSFPAALLSRIFPKQGQPLPDGWRMDKLGTVCWLNPRRPFIDRNESELTSFIPMEAVEAASGMIKNLHIKPYNKVNKGYTYFEEGDVLFAKITPCMQNGKHTIARGLIDGIGFGSTEFHVLRPKKEIISEIVWYFLRQPYILSKATEHFTGTVGQQRLPQDYLADLEIPVPPLNEQKKIVVILNEQMSAIKKAIKIAQAEMKSINALPKALLRQAFDGGI